MAAKGQTNYETIKRDELKLEKKAQSALLNTIESHIVGSEQKDEHILIHYCRKIGLEDALFIKNLVTLILKIRP